MRTERRGDRRQLGGGRKARFAAAIGVLVWTCLALAPLRADISFEIQHGFNRIARGEALTPVKITLEGDGTDREVELRIIGTPSVRRRVELPRQTKKQVFLYTEPFTDVLPSRFPRLEIYAGGEQIHTGDLMTYETPRRFFVPVVGGPSLEFPQATMPSLGFMDVPDSPLGFDGLDGIVIYPRAWEQLQGRSLRALATWVRRGGALFIPALEGSAPAILPPDHPLGPLRVSGSRQEPRLLAYLTEALDGPKVDLSKPARSEDGLTVAAPPAGFERVFPPAGGGGEGEDEFPALLFRRPEGAGEVFVFGFDPASLPRDKRWPQRTRVLTELLAPRDFGSVFRAHAPSSSADPTRYVTSGEKQRTSVGWFMVFLAVYLFVIAPFDLWLVRRLGRPRLTWVTFPAAVILFSVAAWALGRGRIGAVEYREATWIDHVSTAPGGVLGTSIAAVYSDANHEWTLFPEVESGFVWPPSRETGTVTYDDDVAPGALRQKMYIWSHHRYRVEWRPERMLTNARIVPDASGALARVQVAANLSRDPILWFVVVDGDVYEFPPDDVRQLAGGVLELSLAGEPTRLEAGAWSAAGGVRARSVARWDASRYYEDPRSRGSRARYVAAVIAEPWPTLRVRERSPVPQGITVVRSSLEIGAALVEEP